MAASLVVNGTNSIFAQGSISSIIASQLTNGTDPAHGNFYKSQGHFVNNTVAGHLLICMVNTWVYANLGGAYVPVLGPPTTPGFTWLLAGVIVSDTQGISDASAQGGMGYATIGTAIYYILNAPLMPHTA